MPEAAPARVSRAEHKRRTRAALVYAARGLFMAKGYNDTTADAIARAAGVSRASFYLHFRGKAEIVVELMRGIEPEVLGAYRRLGAMPDPDVAAVERWLREHAELWRRHRMEFTAMEQALAGEAQVADEWFGLYGRLGDTVLDAAGVPQGPVRDAVRARLLAVVMSIDRSMYFTVLREHGEIFELAVHEIAEMLAEALERVRETVIR